MEKGKYYFKCVVWGLVALLLLGFITMLLWNWLIPILFNGPAISYLQALGLLALSKILFSGFGRKPYNASQSPYWKQKFQEKVASLDPAEKEAFKQKMKEKWCNWENKSSRPSSSND